MKKMLIAYESMSGNTEDIARILLDELKNEKLELHISTICDLDLKDLQEYDFAAAGSYTWGDGDLPYEIEDLAEEWGNADLSMVKAAFFGSGDRAYPKFCAAADLLKAAFEKAGADVYPEVLKVEFAPDEPDQEESCRRFAKEFINWARAEGADCHVL